MLWGVAPMACGVGFWARVDLPDWATTPAVSWLMNFVGGDRQECGWGLGGHPACLGTALADGKDRPAVPKARGWAAAWAPRGSPLLWGVALMACGVGFWARLDLPDWATTPTVSCLRIALDIGGAWRLWPAGWVLGAGGFA